MTKKYKAEIKKIIEEVLTERFGCNHKWVTERKGELNWYYQRRCTVCNESHFDSMTSHLAKAGLYGTQEPE